MRPSLRMSRRELLVRGGSTLAVLAFFDSPLFAWGRAGERTIPFLEQPTEPPIEIPNLLDWQGLDSWITANDKFFAIGHFGPQTIREEDWRLEVTGLVERPGSYTLAAIKELPKQECVFTLECSGNHGFDWFQGGIGNARWGGARLATVLERAGVRDDAVEIVFFGADRGQVGIPYINGFGEKVTEFETEARFARSMSLAEAMDPDNILCYEMNGETLPAANGFPLRLIAPRWYGIANVKWLERIELRDTRFLGTFMTERYVTVREETLDSGEVVWRQTPVGKVLLKSLPAKVTEKDGAYRVYGAAWGAPVSRVEVRIDNGPWKTATIDEGADDKFAWKFWHLDWPSPGAGEHTVTSRAIDVDGNVQPAPDDPPIATKHTYWESNGQVTRTIRIT